MLARAQMRPAPGRWVSSGAIVWWTSLKLVVHPAAVWLAAQALRAGGVTVPDAGLITLMLAAALPSASNVSMLAEREGANTALVARIILWTTGLALLSISLWSASLGVAVPSNG
jgi:predicted permease